MPIFMNIDFIGDLPVSFFEKWGENALESGIFWRWRWERSGHQGKGGYCFINDSGVLFALQKNITYLKSTDAQIY
jgi:hypothetical protein